MQYLFKYLVCYKHFKFMMLLNNIFKSMRLFNNVFMPIIIKKYVFSNKYTNFSNILTMFTTISFTD